MSVRAKKPLMRLSAATLRDEIVDHGRDRGRAAQPVVERLLRRRRHHRLAGAKREREQERHVEAGNADGHRGLPELAATSAASPCTSARAGWMHRAHARGCYHRRDPSAQRALRRRLPLRDDEPRTRPARTEPPPTATLAQVARAVFWSFFGVRKGKDMQQDAVTIKPLHVVIVGLVCGARLRAGAGRARHVHHAQRLACSCFGGAVSSPSFSPRPSRRSRPRQPPPIANAGADLVRRRVDLRSGEAAPAADPDARRSRGPPVVAGLRLRCHRRRACAHQLPRRLAVRARAFDVPPRIHGARRHARTARAAGDRRRQRSRRRAPRQAGGDVLRVRAARARRQAAQGGAPVRDGKSARPRDSASSRARTTASSITATTSGCTSRAR